MYDYFVRGTKTYFVYNNKHYYNDSSLGEVWKYHDFEISASEYQRAYRNKGDYKMTTVKYEVSKYITEEREININDTHNCFL